MQQKYPKLVAVSGLIGAGKDYLAGKLIEELESRGYRTVRTSFATALKAETDDLIALIRRSVDRADAVALVAEYLNTTVDKACTIIGFLYDDVRADPTITAYTRTLNMRSTLQFVGTEVRRNQDGNYWTNKFLQNAEALQTETVLVVTDASDDKNPFMFVTDGRFPNEMDCVKDAGGYLIRVEVDDAVLTERRMKRDGITYTPEQLNHPSETALNGYSKYDEIVGAELTVEETVDRMIAFFADR